MARRTEPMTLHSATAAVTIISTCGEAMRPQTAFISSKFAMSANQVTAYNMCERDDPASRNNLSTQASQFSVCFVTVAP